MTRQPSEILASLIGNLHIQLATLTSQLEHAFERIKELEAQAAKPDASSN